MWTHFEDPGSERNVIRLQIVSSNTLVAGYAQEVIRVQKMSNTVSTPHFTLILCKMFLGVVVPSKSYTSAGLPQIRQAFHTLPFLIRSS